MFFTSLSPLLSFPPVQVSLKNYRLAEYPENEEDEIDEDFYNAEDQEFSDAAISGINTGRGHPGSSGPKKNSSSSPKKKVTKHDLDADGVKNARRMDKLPVLDIGNSSKVKDLRLPYKVFNSLKNHASRASGKENARNKTRLFDKDDYSTQDSVMDKRTRILVCLLFLFFFSSLLFLWLNRFLSIYLPAPPTCQQGDH